MLCMRDNFFSMIKDSYLKSYLLLLACAYCDSCKEKDTIVLEDKTLTLLVLPIFSVAGNMNEKHALMRAVSIVTLEKVQDLYGGIASADELEIAIFSKAYNEHQKDEENNTKKQVLIDLYKSISECSYLELLKRVIHAEQYGIAMNMIMNFFSFNVQISGHGFYVCYSYRSESNEEKDSSIFFEIGRSLDEGQTEWLARKLTKYDNSRNIESRYHTEVSFIQRLHNVFSEDEFIKAFMDANPAEFFYKLTNESEKCCFYNLFKYTDNMDWRQAIKLLNEFIKTNSEDMKQ
jgi:hypothetical protein